MKLSYRHLFRFLGKGSFIHKEWVLLLVLGSIIFLALYPREKIFTIDVFTEVVSFQITDPKYSEWNIGGASIQTDFFDESGEAILLAPFSRLEPSKGVEVQLQRHGVGPVYLKLTCSGGSVGRVDIGDGKYIDLGDWVLITIRADAKPKIFPFRGTLDIGDDVSVGVDSILLDGKLSIIEEKLFTSGHYTAGQEVLISGDRVQLWKNKTISSDNNSNRSCNTVQSNNHSGKKRVRSELDGFIRTEPEKNYSEPVNALNLVAHGKADYAEVNRFGSAGYEVKVHPLTRFVNDPILGIVFGVLTAFLILLEVVSKIRASNTSKEKEVEKNE